MSAEHAQMLMAVYNEQKRKNEDLTEMAKKRRNTASVADDDAANADGTDSDDLETLSRSTQALPPIALSYESDFADDDDDDEEVVAHPQFDADEETPVVVAPTQEIGVALEESDDFDDEAELAFVEKAIETLENASRDLFSGVKIVALGTAPKIEKLLKSKSNNQAELTLVIVPDDDGFLSASALLEDEKDARRWLAPKKKVWLATLRNLIMAISVDSPSNLPAGLTCYKRCDEVLVPSFSAIKSDADEVRVQKSRITSTLQRLMTQKLKLKNSGHCVDTIHEMMSSLTERAQ